MNDSEIDYRTLLAKYIEHVGAEEGCTFISRLYLNKNCIYEGMSDRVTFSKDEVEALEECSNLYYYMGEDLYE